MTRAEQKAAYGKGRTALNGHNVTALGNLLTVLQEQGVDTDQIGEVKALWHKTRVNDEGVEEYAGSSVMLSPSWDQGPEWPVVQPAKPVKVSVPRRGPSGAAGAWRTALVMPDVQVGFRRLTDGSLDPFHDERAISIALQIAEAERPDLTVLLGDFLDLAPMGRFRQEAGFGQTVQPALDRGHEILAMVSAVSKETRFLKGNHDLRLETYIIDNAMSAFGLKRAGAPRSDWPVMSVPNLLRLDELNVEYVDAYPSGASYINDELACIHGHTVNSSGSTAAKVVKDEMVSVIFGHIHRIETQYKTRNTRGKPSIIVAHSPGCLARIDGAVPSTTSSTDQRSGRPARSWEDWQQGVTVVRFREDGRFALESVPIIEGFALHGGQEFSADTTTLEVAA